MDVFAFAGPEQTLPRVDAVSACAGLRRSLLAEWRTGLPLREAPFDGMARHLGASSRELLSHLRRLQQEGALLRVGATWSVKAAPLHGWCALQAKPGRGPALWEAVSGMPGAVACESLEDSTADAGARGSDVWVELVACCAGGLQSQFDGLSPLLRQPPVFWPLAAAGVVGRSPGPSQVPALAAWLENGVPVELHPFIQVARENGSSPRALCARLRDWQAEGHLDGFGLHPAEALAAATPVTTAVLELKDDRDDWAERVAAEPGIAGAQRLTPREGWQRPLKVVACGHPAVADRHLRQAAQGLRLDLTGARIRRARRRVMPAPRLYACCPDGGKDAPGQPTRR